MSERLSIVKTPIGANFIDADDNGHGATGQVKKASFWGREVKVQGHKMNAGSLIDFLNALPEVTDDKKLTKGWFFGYGGSSNKEIQKLFNDLYPIDPSIKSEEEMKAAFKDKIANAPDAPSVDELDDSLRKKTRNIRNTIVDAIQVGSGRYFLRPGNIADVTDKGFRPLDEDVLEANYIINLMGRDHGSPLYHEDLDWILEGNLPDYAITLAKDVAAHSHSYKPDLVICENGLGRTSTFVAIVELFRNKDIWDQDLTNATARKVIVAVLEDLAITDQNRMPIPFLLNQLLSDWFINAVRIRASTAD